MKYTHGRSSPAIPAAQRTQPHSTDVNRRAYSFLENHLDDRSRRRGARRAPGRARRARPPRGRRPLARRILRLRTRRPHYAPAPAHRSRRRGRRVPRRRARARRRPHTAARRVQPPASRPAQPRLRSAGPAAPEARRTAVQCATYRPPTAAKPRRGRRTAQQELRAPPQPQLLRTTGSGLYVVHSSSRTPAAIDVPDLAAVRTLDLRFEGSEFRIAASRPLAMEPGDAARFVIRAHGEPLDLVVYVPRDTRSFLLSAAGVRIAEATGGRPRALCGNVVIQSPTDFQTWLTFRPQDGQIDCRPVGRL
jgi:hypothetical protein